jgi:2-methylcitrate dehydratase PrpD
VSSPARAASCSELAARLRAAGDARDEALGEVVGLRVLDALGALVAGRGVAATRVIPEDSGLLADVRRLCATVRCSEVDDFERQSCTTPGSVAVPVALLVGAARDARSPRVRAGIIAGYEAMIAIGEAIDGPHRLARGVWPSYLAAPIAAAAVTAAVLDLDEERTTHALAIAATRAVGSAGRIQEPTSRWFTYGCAAADGVSAALAAEAGMLGDPDALAGALPAGTGVDLDASCFAAPVARITRVDVKPFCTARQAQAAVEAATLAHAELDGAPVAEIEVAVPAAYRAMVDQPEPGSRLTSLMSAQRQIAVALTGGAALYDVARDDLRLSAEAERIMRATRVVADDELTKLYPDVLPARVRIGAVGGGAAECLVRDPLGARERPLGWAALSEKHTRIGAWGERLAHAIRLSRELGAGAGHAPARELLNLTQDLPQEAVT